MRDFSLVSGWMLSKKQGGIRLQSRWKADTLCIMNLKLNISPLIWTFGKIMNFTYPGEEWECTNKENLALDFVTFMRCNEQHSKCESHCFCENLSCTIMCLIIYTIDVGVYICVYNKLEIVCQILFILWKVYWEHCIFYILCHTWRPGVRAGRLKPF